MMFFLTFTNCFRIIYKFILRFWNKILIFPGVVFNEMKGAYSNSQSLFGQHLLNNLVPDHTYGFSSGGEFLICI